MHLCMKFIVVAWLSEFKVGIKPPYIPYLPVYKWTPILELKNKFFLFPG